jgi:hypothetical protein
MAGKNCVFGIDSGFGGSAAMGSAGLGGSGGNISKISASVGTLYISGGGGGAGVVGGAGASVSGVTVAARQFVRAVAAGDGGSGTTDGHGGSISNVKVAGDIGDYSSDFNTAAIDLLGMGGLIAGQGGGNNSALNGSISDVSATRIAAIVAGRVDGAQVSDTNDVISISGISAKVIGADLNHDGVADDILGVGWTGVGDQLVDGIVIVKSGGYSGTLPTSAFAAFLFQI